MKTTALFFACVMMSAMTFGQTTPQFRTGESPDATTGSINNYLNDQMKNLQCAALHCRPGTEVIAFVVTPGGELDGFRVINSVSPAIDDEVIRVLKGTSGSWVPGTLNGEQVAMELEVAIVYVPDHNFNLVEEAKHYLDKGNQMLLLKKDPKRALRCFNEAFRLLPNEESILAARSRCRYELGDVQGAILDCRRIMELNGYTDLPPDASDPIVLLEQLRGHVSESIVSR